MVSLFLPDSSRDQSGWRNSSQPWSPGCLGKNVVPEGQSVHCTNTALRTEGWPGLNRCKSLVVGSFFHRTLRTERRELMGLTRVGMGEKAGLGAALLRLVRSPVLGPYLRGIYTVRLLPQCLWWRCDTDNIVLILCRRKLKTETLTPHTSNF